MGTVLIKNASITDLDVEAIVNAANSSLWAGGGVCGVIFAVLDPRTIDMGQKILEEQKKKGTA